MIDESRQLNIVHPCYATPDERTYIVARCPYTLGEGCYRNPDANTTYICRDVRCWRIGELYATYVAERGYWTTQLDTPEYITDAAMQHAHDAWQAELDGERVPDDPIQMPLLLY